MTGVLQGLVAWLASAFTAVVGAATFQTGPAIDAAAILVVFAAAAGGMHAINNVSVSAPADEDGQEVAT